MRNFDQAMMRLQNKLPDTVFDGKELKVANHDELQKVAGFLGKYQVNAKAALDAWKQLGRGQNEERRSKLNANIQYHDALLAAYNEKSKTIKAPQEAPPAQMRKVSMDDIFIGPDVGKGKPFLIDTVGEWQTMARVWGHPGNKAKPSRYSIKLEFWVRYENIASDDVVMIQTTKGAKKLGRPIPCSPTKVYPELKLAWYKCDAPKARADYNTLFNVAGDLNVHLTYRKIIEGKEFKKFASLKVRAMKLKKGSANNPAVAWASNHDIELGASTLQEITSGGQSGTAYEMMRALDGALNKDETFAVIHTWFKSDKSHIPTRMACLYNGKRVAEAQGHRETSHSSWSFIKKGSTKQDDNEWQQHQFQLYSLHPHPRIDGSKGSYHKPQHYLPENPGKYRCVVTSEGEIVKEMNFEVGGDGEIIKPACQSSSMNTLQSVTLLSTKNVRVSTKKWDKNIGKKAGYAGGVTWSKGCPTTR